MRMPDGGIELIYVDSDSRDDSVRVAEGAGARVIRVNHERPTAARARNAGWRVTSAPFVLFLDGDCQVEPEFAIEALRQFDDTQVAVVWGRLRGADPRASLFNRAMDAEWMCLRTLPPGPTFYGTGNGLIRRAALEAVNGFDSNRSAGENTDLGRRLQALGYVVLHVDLPMVRHDSALVRFGQYWRRLFRMGYSYARLEKEFLTSGQPLFRSDFAGRLGGVLILLLLAGAGAAVLLRVSDAPR